MKIVRATLTLARATLVAAASLAAHAADGLIAVKSPHSGPHTAGKLEAALQEKRPPVQAATGCCSSYPDS